MANSEIATLGGGCFWCLEAVYQRMRGVVKVESGYMGGHVDNPTYKQVCSGESGHVEVVQVTFDPTLTSFRQILEVFFVIHDPTTRDRQGNDAGPQYRSAIFYHSAEQQRIAREVIAEVDAQWTWGAPAVTEVVNASTFYVAEDYHQNYYKTNPNQPYCAYVVAPKVAKFEEKFADRLTAGMP